MFKWTEVLVFFAIVLSSYKCWVMSDGSHDTDNSHVHDEDIGDIHSEEAARRRFNMIFPGTKWCGAGDIADNYDDLGPARETDMCCRDHDNCSDYMAAGETKHNLTNTAFYTRLACECDEKFRLCLRDVNTGIAREIGKIYFNALGTKCYRRDYPVTGCNKHGGWFRRKCVDYSYNTSAEQQYQWFDVKDF